MFQRSFYIACTAVSVLALEHAHEVNSRHLDWMDDWDLDCPVECEADEDGAQLCDL